VQRKTAGVAMDAAVASRVDGAYGWEPYSLVARYVD
jgi:hypothetical protein